MGTFLGPEIQLYDEPEDDGEDYDGHHGVKSLGTQQWLDNGAGEAQKSELLTLCTLSRNAAITKHQKHNMDLGTFEHFRFVLDHYEKAFIIQAEA